MAADPGLFARIISEVTPDDYAILYMTSGATGEPKMGLATNWAVGANLDMGPHVLPLGPEDSTIVFLPSAHIAQRVVIQFLPMRCGTPVYFSEGLYEVTERTSQHQSRRSFSLHHGSGKGCTPVSAPKSRNGRLSFAGCSTRLSDLG